MWVSFTDTVLSNSFSFINLISSAYLSLTSTASSRVFTNSPKMSIVAEKPSSFSFLTILKTSFVSVPATYGFANGLTNHSGRNCIELANILFMCFIMSLNLILYYGSHQTYLIINLIRVKKHDKTSKFILTIL